MVKNQQKLISGQRNEEMIQQADNALEKGKVLLEMAGVVCLVEDVLRSFRKTRKLKAGKTLAETRVLTKEVKEVIRGKPNLFSETADEKKSVAMLGRKEEEIKQSQAVKVSTIMKRVSKVIQGASERKIVRNATVGNDMNAARTVQ